MIDADAAAAAAALGQRLRALVTPRTVAACLGVSTVTAVPLVRARVAPGCPPAAAPIWLWCAGQPVAVAPLARALGPAAVATAIALELVRIVDALAHPGRRLAPIGAGLVPCDLASTTAVDRVPWPDDSTLHLLGCLPPGLLGRWLDVGSGPAALPLAVGARAREVRATDLSGRAVALARLGADLGHRPRPVLAVADLLVDAGGGWDLISFNAPIPAEHAGAIDAGSWHRATPGADVLPRFWREAAAALAPGGEVVVHGALGDDDALSPPAIGAVTIARYTPPGGPGFGITRWRPDGARAWRAATVPLGPRRPYLARADLDAIEADADPAPTGDMG